MRSDGPAQGTPGEARTIIPHHDPTIKVGDTRGGQLEGLSGPSGDQATSGLMGPGGRQETGLAAIEGPVGKKWAGYTGTPGI